MKTWISIGPTEQDLNRIESEIGNIYPNILTIRDTPYVWGGLKKFPSIKVNALPDSTIDGIASDDIKTLPVDCDTFTFSNSVATETPLRGTPFVEDGPIEQPITGDMLMTGPVYNSRIVAINGYSNYSGNNLIIISYPGLNDYCQASVAWKNDTAVTTGVITIDDRVPAGETKKHYYNIGPGEITITNTNTSPRSGGGVDARLKRCKLPLTPGNPVQLYSSDYRTIEQRLMTASDITNITVG